MAFCGLMRIGETNGFHRPEAQSFAAPFRHDLDRQAAVEIPRGFTFMEFRLVRREKRIRERLVFFAGHRAVEVGSSFGFRLALVISRLGPGDRHVDAFSVDNRSNGVKKSQAVFVRGIPDRIGQRARGQRPGRDDPPPIVR